MKRIERPTSLFIESLFLGDYDRQSMFAGEILREANVQFLGIVSAGALKGAAEFISFIGNLMRRHQFFLFIQLFCFIGLDKPPVPENTVDIYGQNRNSLVFCVNLVLGAIKRCSWPDDPERATRGNNTIYNSAISITLAARHQ